MAKKLFFLVLIVVGSIFFLSLEADANRAVSHEEWKEKIDNHLIVGKNSSRRLENKNEQNVQSLVHKESEGHEENKETIADEKCQGDDCGEDQECDDNDDNEEGGDECGEDQECDNNDGNENDECGEDQECNKNDDNKEDDGDGKGDENTPRRRVKRGDVTPQIKNRGKASRSRGPGS